MGLALPNLNESALDIVHCKVKNKNKQLTTRPKILTSYVSPLELPVAC